METNTPSYVELQNNLKQFLAKELETRHITVEQIMAILLIFGQTSTVDEIDVFLEIFGETFPVLRDFDLQRREGKKVAVKDQVKDTVIAMIATDPMRAAQLAKDATNNDISWEELLAKYPELNQV